MDLKVQKLFQQKNLIFISTINSDGSPQLTPVWGNYDDGYVLVSTAEGRLKHKNVLRDPRVSISVVDHDNPLNMTTIKGEVIEIIPDYDYSHANKLTKQYMGIAEYPFKRDGERRIIFKIKPMKIFVMPDIQ
jgi:PPOX class probable F420-dependent enzyme